jgi:small GTP-binding protein
MMQSAQDNDTDEIYKCIIVGNCGVGKSCLMKRFVDRVFIPTHLTTIGMDFQARVIMLDDNRAVKLQLWDAAGQDRFRTITSVYYRGCEGAMVVFNVNDVESFLDLESWMREIKQWADPEVSLLLVGNKTDLAPALRQVPRSDAEAFAKKYNMQYIETSAYDTTNVDSAFERIAHTVDTRRRAECKSVTFDIEAAEEANKVDLSAQPQPKCCVIQ